MALVRCSEVSGPCCHDPGDGRSATARCPRPAPTTSRRTARDRLPQRRASGHLRRVGAWSKRLPSARSPILRSPCALVELYGFEGVARARSRPARRRQGRRREYAAASRTTSPKRLRSASANSLRAGETSADDGWSSRQGHLLGLGDDQLVAALGAGSALTVDLVDLLLHIPMAATGTVLMVGSRWRSCSAGVSHAPPGHSPRLGLPLGKIASRTVGDAIP